MCGIAAVCALDPFSAVDRMTDLLGHRGPDDAGVLRVHEKVALGHARLSVLDPDERSRCPMVRDHVTLVYNGELWNFQELRDELMLRHGRWFSTTGDTEVVCQALAEWGPEALPRMEGMFAAVWWDAERETLYAARDRFGEIPLHVARTTESVSLTSELKALDGARTVARYVQPGSVLEIRPGRLWGGWSVEESRWYEPSLEPRSVGRADAAVELRARVAAAVKERAISDVPVCTLLSGGIDSTAVAYHLRKHVPNLVAYTAVMDPKGPDLRQARTAAGVLGLPLVEVAIPEPTRADMADVVRRIEMPYKAQVEIAWSCLHLARRMRDDGFKVTFSGEGSDELWASYDNCWWVLEGGAEWHRYRRDLFQGQHRKNFARANKIFMAHGVEARLPFLHTSLVEFALSMPADVCYRKRPIEKLLLKEAYRGILPDEIVGRPKMAFQVGNGSRDRIAAMFGEDSPRAFYTKVYNEEYA